MKNNLLKIALSLGMIVAVSGMQDASCMNSDKTLSNQNKIIIRDSGEIGQNMTNINNESSASSNKVAKAMKNIKKMKRSTNSSNQKSNLKKGLFNHDKFEKLYDKKVEEAFNKKKKFADTIEAKYERKFEGEFAIKDQFKNDVDKYLNVTKSTFLKSKECSNNDVVKLYNVLRSFIGQDKQVTLLNADRNTVKEARNKLGDALPVLKTVLDAMKSADNGEQKILYHKIRDVNEEFRLKKVQFDNKNKQINDRILDLEQQIKTEPDLLAQRIEQLKQELEEKIELMTEESNERVKANEGKLEKFKIAKNKLDVIQTRDYSMYPNILQDSSEYLRKYKEMDMNAFDLRQFYDKLSAQEKKLVNSAEELKEAEDAYNNQSMLMGDDDYYAAYDNYDGENPEDNLNEIKEEPNNEKEENEDSGQEEEENEEDEKEIKIEENNNDNNEKDDNE